MTNRPPPRNRPFPTVRMADERVLLVELLDWYRAGIVHKVDGLDDEQARRSLVASPTTISGILKHLTLVEESWFVDRFAGRGLGEPWSSVDWESDPDWEFRTARDDRLADLVAEYQSACARSREITDGAALDDVSASSNRPFTLRFVLVHMIEETARHLGHLDILREQIDGVTGG